MEQTLAQIAEKLGFEAARIWPQAVMITWVQSLFWLIVDPLMLIVSIAGPVKFWSRIVTELNKPEEGTIDDCTSIALAIASLITLIALVIAIDILVSFPRVLTGFLYPEATTALQLLGRK